MNKRSIVREFFIKHYNPLVVTPDVKTTEERSQRYNSLQAYYMNLVEENECACFSHEWDIVDGLTKNYESNLLFLKHGVVPF